jgi:hypothetical protein
MVTVVRSWGFLALTANVLASTVGSTDIRISILVHITIGPMQVQL